LLTPITKEMDNTFCLKTILTALVLFSITIISYAQELKLIEFRADKTMTDAVKFPKKDLNGNSCGLIRLGLSKQTLADPIFEGDIVSCEFKEGEWWLYMPQNSNWLTIKSKTGNCVPLRCEFEGIISNVTYVMTVVPKGIITIGKINGHRYVDMGLSVLWADCNIGALYAASCGETFAWGETTPMEDCSWLDLKYCIRDNDLFSKYNTRMEYGRVDNKTVLEPMDDAATVNWGEAWRMPTIEDFMELKNCCDWEWTKQDNSWGYKVKSKITGNSIFLPACNGWDGNAYGLYWTSTLNDIRPNCGEGFQFGKGFVYNGDAMYSRCNVLNIRPVTSRIE